MAPLLLKGALHPSRDQVLTLIAAAIGGLLMVGFLEATDAEFRPASALGGAFTVGPLPGPFARAVTGPFARAVAVPGAVFASAAVLSRLR